MIPDKLVVGPYLWPKCEYSLHLITDVGQLPFAVGLSFQLPYAFRDRSRPVVPLRSGPVHHVLEREPYGGLGCLNHDGMLTGLRA